MTTPDGDARFFVMHDAARRRELLGGHTAG